MARGRIDPTLLNVRVFWSHRSDALYQGTTLVGPLEGNKDLGFRVCVRASIFGQNQYDCVLMSTQNQYEYCVIFEFSRRLF